MKSRSNRLLAIASLAGSCLATSASAQTTYTKQDNTTSLNLASSYTANSGVPTSNDTLVIDNTLTVNRTSALRGDVSVLGINMQALPVSTASRQLQINPTAGATLTIYGGGITKDANTSALIINSAVKLGASQTWTLNGVSGTGTGNFQLNTTSFDADGKTLAINGAGFLDLRPSGSLGFGSTVTIDTPVSINSSSAAVTFGGANTFNILNIVSGKASGATIGNFGAASNFGDGGTNTAIVLGGTNSSGFFEYTGDGDSSNRTFTMDRRSNGNTILVTDSSATLTLSGNIATNGGNSTGEKDVALTVGGAGNLKLEGVVSNHNGAFKTSLNKQDGGALTLSNANTYQGGTSITGGTLLVNNTTGSGTGTGVVTVGAAGATGTPTLGGGGTIGGATTIAAAGGGAAGTHSVGAVATGGAEGVGKQTFSSSISYETGSIFEWNLAATPSETGRGTSYDAVNAASLGSTTGAIFRVVLNDTQDFSEAFWNIDRTWSDIFKTGDAGSNLSIASIFSGTVQYYNGGGTTLASISAPTVEGAFTFSGTDLKWTAVPEPTSALAGLLIAAGLLRRRRNA